MSVGSRRPSYGLPRGEKAFQHPLLDYLHGLRRHALEIERIITHQRLALPRGLGCVVDNLDPIRQDARANLGFEFARKEVDWTAGFGEGFPWHAQIVAQ